LLGLLFVAISMNAETILSVSHRHLREVAGQTFPNFLLLVAVTLVFLFPKVRFECFGVLGAYGICWVVYRLYFVLRMVGRNYHWVQVFRRLLPAAIACSLLTYAGFLAPRTDKASILTASGSASALLLISAAVSSWELLVKVAEYRRRLGHRPYGQRELSLPASCLRIAFACGENRHACKFEHARTDRDRGDRRRADRCDRCGDFP
jgi:hypothetical protein